MGNDKDSTYLKIIIKKPQQSFIFLLSVIIAEKDNAGK